MKKKLAMFIASLGMVFGFALVPATALATLGTTTGNTNTIACGSGEEIDLTGTNCVPIGDADETINDTIELAIRILQIIVGIISVVMIIFGGIKYVTSGGDSGGVSSAKNTIIYAIIGLVIVALAEIIVQFVLNRVDDV